MAESNPSLAAHIIMLGGYPSREGSSFSERIEAIQGPISESGEPLTDEQLFEQYTRPALEKLGLETPEEAPKFS